MALTPQPKQADRARDYRQHRLLMPDDPLCGL
jgi:hypothetical protein